ncbi:hypothetical protein ACET3Z_031505 [Daucus carota]
MEASKETGSQPPKEPFLCVNNCGFFGTAETMNMCSKCYKDVILKHGLQKLASTSIETIVRGGSGSTHKEPAVGFNCWCGNLHCADHRYLDKHECSFGYRAAGNDAIGKANPVVKREKLDKI